MKQKWGWIMLGERKMCIAASVIESYRDKFDNIVKEYGISDNQIHVIDDSTDGVFLWWLQ